MKFEVGKFYKTRDGRKAQIFMLDRGDKVMVGAVFNNNTGLWSTSTWRMNGCWYDRPHELDIISEWREPIERKTVACV